MFKYLLSFDFFIYIQTECFYMFTELTTYCLSLTFCMLVLKKVSDCLTFENIQ